MRSRIFSARNAARKFGELLDAAEADPVAVYRHGRPSAAVMSWNLFEQYRKAYEDALETKRVEHLELSLKALIAGKLGTGQRALALAKRLKDGDILFSKESCTDDKAER